MIVKCKECGTSIEVDESQYTQGEVHTAICPLCCSDVKITVAIDDTQKITDSSAKHENDEIICPNCGAQHSREAIYCSMCGYRFATVFVQQEEGCSSEIILEDSSNLPAATLPPMPLLMSHQSMFSNPFSFNGRIRCLEYGISVIIYYVWYIFFEILMTNGSRDSQSGIVLLFLITCIPFYWFMLAQSAKRCHDRGNSGWYQLIPLYGLWLLFGAGDKGPNRYGLDPKR